MIALIADVHLGLNIRSPNVSKKSLSELLRDTFREIVVKIRDLSPDLLVIAGDLFDSKTPKPEDFSFVGELFRELTEEGIEVLYVFGNHEAPVRGFEIGKETKTLMKAFEWIKGVTVVDSLRRDGMVIEKAGYRILALPYIGLKDPKARGQLLTLYRKLITEEEYDYVVTHMCIDEYGEQGPEALCLKSNYFKKLVLAGHYHKHLVAPSYVYPGSIVARPLVVFEPKHNKIEPNAFKFVIVDKRVNTVPYQGVAVAKYKIHGRIDQKGLIELVDNLKRGMLILEYPVTMSESEIKDLAVAISRRYEDIIIYFRPRHRETKAMSIEEFLSEVGVSDDIMKSAIEAAVQGKPLLRKLFFKAYEVYKNSEERDLSKLADEVLDSFIKEVIG